MDEKRKPYATISFRKPSGSFLLSAFLTLAIVSIVVISILQEREKQALQLASLQISLEDAQFSLRQAEEELGAVAARLSAAESKLAKYQQQFAEPVGYFNLPGGQGKALRLFSCSVIALESLLDGDSSSATLIAYDVLDHKVSANLRERANYESVGEYTWSSGSDEVETMFFYLRQDVLAVDPFSWADSEDWAVVYPNWEDYLDEHCLGL